MDADTPTRCPSAECKSGNVLLGVALPDGTVAFAAQRIVVDDEFVRIARLGRAPERRFRFSGACARGACRQWDGRGCSLIDRLLDAPPRGEPESVPNRDLPECSIRPECRWYLQRGAEACAICPEVVTDAAGDGGELPARVAAERERRQAELALAASAASTVSSV